MTFIERNHKGIGLKGWRVKRLKGYKVKGKGSPECITVIIKQCSLNRKLSNIKK